MLSSSPLTFANSTYLWLLLFVLPLGFLFYWTEEQKKHLLAKVIAMRLRSTLVGGVSASKRWVRFLFLLLAFVFAIITLAQPRKGYEEREVKSQGRDVIAVIDVSRSMLATDVTPTRLARSQLLGQDLLELLPGDRIGLVAFAGRGFLEAPLTLDHSAIADALADLDMNLIPMGGTNIAEAIKMAISAFGKSEGDRSIVLMTDGEELEASGVTAAKEAAAQNIKIFTIGIGSAEGSLISIKNELGENDFVRDEHGKPVLSKLDVERLQEISKVTGGFYEPFGSDAVRTIVEKGILPLNASNTSSLTLRRPQERYAWPLATALFFLTLWCLSSERRRRKSAVLALLLLGCFSSPGIAEGDLKMNKIDVVPGARSVVPQCISNARGDEHRSDDAIRDFRLFQDPLSAYAQGDYANALRDFEQQIQSGSPSRALRFDAGAAAYKQQDYKKAETYFTQAMTSSSKQIQQMATYNLANTLVRQGETAQKKAEKLADWNNALQHYETVLKADPHNKNAQENRDLVKKMIEKLKQEKEQEPPKNQPQQSSPNNQNNKQDKQKSNPNNSNNQNNPNNQQQDQQKENSPPSSGNNGSTQNPDKKSDSTPPSQEQPSGDSSSKQQDQQKENSQASPKPSAAEPNKDSGSDHGDNPQPTPPSNKDNPSAGGNQEKEKQQPSPSAADQNAPSPQEQGAQSKAAPTPSEKKQGALGGGEQGKKEEANTAAAEKENDNGMSLSQAEAVLRSVEDEERRVPFSQQQQNTEETTRDW
ncbi:MAG: VWA domain-containing protein [Chthoniobacterales bacterium]|nr:VWA domain-containing protein [Chthoniobacterales bacterium]